MISPPLNNQIIETVFRERIVPFLDSAKTPEALHETENIYHLFCEQKLENLSSLYQNFFSTYEHIRQKSAQQTTLDCIQLLNTKAKNNPLLA